MKASVDRKVVAQGDDVIGRRGYQYFPASAVRLDWLEKAAKTADDRVCPHGVQFYDVIVGGTRHPGAACSYEIPARKWHRSVADSASGRTSSWGESRSSG
jgi:uncharacterized protein (DUF427 family)